MLLTNCAACAAPLQHLAKQCGRCKTRYCGPACQEQHWVAGHKDHCRRIKRGGGAEAYHADKKYKEAAALAVSHCAAEAKGRTCYICRDERPDEGLVRMCACHTTEGFAHLSCLARGAQVAVERSADGLGFERWHTCGLCEQKYHGVVKCALGWACWMTYLGRPETDQLRSPAMNLLGLGLSAADHHADALSVKEAELSTLRRFGAPEESILIAQANLAITYEDLGRHEEALQMRRDIYSGRLKLYGKQHEATLLAANNYASSLIRLERFVEAKSLLLKVMPVAQRVLGESDTLKLTMRWNYAGVLFKDPGATLDELREAVTTLEDVGRIARRVLGGAHPHTTAIEAELRDARAALRASALSSKATEDTCRRLREEIAQLKAENAELRRHRINNNTS